MSLKRYYLKQALVEATAVYDKRYDVTNGQLRLALHEIADAIPAEHPHQYVDLDALRLTIFGPDL